jgi:hypothetical protein
MFGLKLSGIKCEICGKALENPLYTKDQDGEGIYWANPKICQFTDVIVNFCGVQHSVEWFGQKIEASKDANNPV